MNPNNRATLEASRRLVEAGIVLETDFYHVKHHNGGYVEQAVLSKDELLSLKMASKMSCNDCIDEVLPAPSMAEVWRELPEEIYGGYTLDVTKMDKDTQATYSRIDCFENYDTQGHGGSENPTDALISLLIWLRGKKGAV
jgi:hypothetical protein